LEERYYETRHESGLRILVAPKDLSAAYVTLGIAYGSRDRFAGGALPMGVAHFLEHKIFERTGGESWEDTFSILGAEVNAYTSDDCTAYMFSATDHVAEGIEALVSMVTDLSVTVKSVSRERRIIAEEIRMNADDPWEVCYANMLRGLYPPAKRGRLRRASESRGNPVREEICGTEASIRRITPAVLREAHGRFYQPEQMVLAVAGRVTPDEVAEAVDRSLKGFVPQGTAARHPTPAPTHRDPKGVWRSRVTASMDTAKPLFTLGIKLEDIPEEPMALVRLDRLATLLAEVLFSRSGDLYDRLFEEGIVNPGISYGASLGRPTIDGGEGYGYLYFSGECDCPDKVFEVVTDYLAELRVRGIDAEAFERAKRTLYADFVYSFDSTEGTASALQTAAMDGVDLYDLLRLDGELTLGDVRDLFLRLCDPARYTLSTVMPTRENI
jgi:predicted Zn-dependent peptidase